MEFLSHVLARTGVYVLAEFTNGVKKAPIHHYYDTVEQLEAAAIAKSKAGKTVYHACATYKTKENRKASNAALMRSLWLDIDVGKSNDANSYEDLKSAVAALGAALKELKLPKPTIVSSGKGLHCYFTFDRDVSADEWKPLAVAFSNALKAVGFKQDPSRTKDAASILRPVGTHWRKGDEELPVKLLNVGVDTPFGLLVEKLAPYAELQQPALPAGFADMFTVTDDLGSIEYPPSSAYQVIKFCPTMKSVADKKGDVPEPLWRAMIGVVKNCTEGEDLCHEWSSGYSGYDFNEAQAKIDNWNSGPTTCAHFSTLSEQCNGCKHAEKIKSPIQLGITEAAETPEIEVVVARDDIEAAGGEVEISAEPEIEKIPMPQGYRWDGHQLTKMVKEGELVIPAAFSDQLIIPMMRIRDVDGTYKVKLRRQVSQGKWREFTIAQSDIAQKNTLVKALAAYEIMTIGPKGDERMQAFIKDYMSILRHTGVEAAVYNSFGWQENNGVFVLGSTGLTPKGEQEATIADGTTHINKGDKQLDEVSGTPESWSALVDELYNHKGAEAAQFTICAAFGSPLVELMNINNWHGIPIGISGTGGSGKTSVCNVALSVFGPSGAFTFQANESGSTEQARVAMFSKYKNLPILHDEITNVKSTEMASLLYAASAGRNKIRLDTKGNFTAQSTLRWNLVSFFTCQTPVSDVLAGAKRVVAEATSLRCFAIDANTDRGWAFPKDSELATELLSNHYGAAGRKYMDFVVKNAPAIAERAHKFVAKYAPDGMEENERYYRRLIATTMFGAKIAQTLGLIHFDLNAVQKWAEHHVATMRNKRATATYSVEEYLNELIGSLQGRVIVTKEIRDARGGNVDSSIEDVRYAPVARRITDPKNPRLIISRKYIADWAAENDIESGWFLDELKKNGYTLPKGTDTAPSATGEMFRLGAGTSHQSSPTRVIEFNTEKLSGAAIPDKQQAKVVSIR